MEISTEEFNQLKGLVSESLQLSRDNQRLLRRMQFWGRVAFGFKVFIWSVVLVLPFILYHYIQPFMSGSSNSLFGYPTATQFQKAFHSATK
jgi:hypothetical protein